MTNSRNRRRKSRGPGPEHWTLIRGTADPDQYPVGLGLARTWLHAIGPTAGWLWLELNAKTWTAEEPEPFDADKVAKSLGVGREALWNAAYRLARHEFIAINPEDGAVVVHATVPSPLARTLRQGGAV